jgi:hypothetical protein
VIPRTDRRRARGLQKANTETYDAARKAVEMLLLSAGWRVKSAGGGHQAVVEIVQRWLGSQPPPGPRSREPFVSTVGLIVACGQVVGGQRMCSAGEFLGGRMVH